MPSPAYSKVVGRNGENAVVQWLIRHGWPHVERRRLMGSGDRGDIAGIPSATIEVKAEKRIDLAGYMKELAVEMENDNAATGVVAVKRRGHTDPDDWYFVMPGRVWRELMREAGY